MKIAAIDIGSNSVRLMTWADGKTLYKKIITTRLGEGLAQSGAMSQAAMERTAEAIKTLSEYGEKDGAQKLYAFATAAVRSSSNKLEFVKKVKDFCGIDIDVISGEEEAKIGILGALGGRDGGTVDVGGASTEVTFQRGGKSVYAYSLNLGTVRLFDMAGRDINALQAVIEEKIKEYGDIPRGDLPVYGLGGTAITLASTHLGLEEYDPTKTDGAVIPTEEIGELARRTLSLSVEEVKAIKGMDKRRADVIGGGFLLTYNILKKMGATEYIASEKDNLEGYVLLREGLTK